MINNCANDVAQFFSGRAQTDAFRHSPYTASPASRKAIAMSIPLSTQSPEICVKQFRQVLLWPLRLMPVQGSEGRHARPWELLAGMGEASPWREVVDEYSAGSGRFQERHYNEFVSFLPYVQRFL